MLDKLNASNYIKKYLNELDTRTREAYEFANNARKNNIDPEDKVDILLADSVGQRVEGLIAALKPEIVGSGMSNRISELEKKYGSGNWRVGLAIAKEVSERKFCNFENDEGAIGIGIRTGLAYTTNGVVSAPLEGLADIKLRKRRDGKPYLSLYFAGPIRAAGGTAQVIPLIIADYIRISKNIDRYDPTQEEIKRYCTEVADYADRVGSIQYKPTHKEIEFIIKKVPVEINGDPGSNIEVSNYKNLPRVETNLIRSGTSLVLSEGIPLKASKINKQLSKWGSDFGLDWSWLGDFLSLKKKVRSSDGASKKNEEDAKITPNYYYISEIVAGRPVFGYPLRAGGFRLRYGRSRLTGDGSWAISPATMRVLKNFLATGTQLRVERPGKSTALTACDSIQGPIVRLEDGSVVLLETEEEALKVKNKIKEVLFLGDILIAHGEFVENGAKLVPPGYCEEWWLEELIKAEEEKQIDFDKELFKKLKDSKGRHKISADTAIEISRKFNIPLHPKFTFHWKDISGEKYASLFNWYKRGVFEADENKRTLEIIGCPHAVSGETITFEPDVKKVLDLLFKEQGEGGIALDCINSTSEVKLRDKSGTYIGARMGRPEKAKLRKLKGSPHVLFPIGKEGGRLRSLNCAVETGRVRAQFPCMYCTECNAHSVYHFCENCGKKTTLLRVCPVCKKKTPKEKCHKETLTYNTFSIDVADYTKKCRQRIGMQGMPKLVKGVRGTSNKDHLVEYLGKGLLRAKHGLNVNKDGTIRFDVTELGITHFKPCEIGLSIEKAKELGYEKDIYDRSLENEEQTIEIFPQDVILPKSSTSEEYADKVLKRVAEFIDDELRCLYNLKPFYNLSSEKDLIGHLIIGLSPHTSAGIIGRILGFSETRGCFAHPYWHDAQRRDLDGEETSVMLLMDAFLNFSRQYLPDKRGTRSMDAPLVLTTILNPEEIDDEVYDVNTAWEHPVEFYEAAQNFEFPWNIKIEQIKDRIGTPAQYEGMGFTHEASNMNKGVKNSAYKLLPTMLEKMDSQIELATKIRAVDVAKVAQLVIEKHFIRDIKGNLRKFTLQTYRCTNCNTIYRRLPLSGVCDKCTKGNLVYTIAEGTIKKYLEPAVRLSRYDEIPNYLKQSLELLQTRIESIFGRDKTKQICLNELWS